MGFNCLKARLRTTLRRQFTFTIKSPEIAGTHFLLTSEGQKTQILKYDPKKGVLVAAKMLFPRVDGFWLCYTSF